MHHHPTESAALPEQTSKQTNEDSTYTQSAVHTFFSFQISIFARGYSGIPGSNGIPGMSEIPGAPGPQKKQGKDGDKGEPGVKGREV